jgi:DNA-binding transcriptional LysR family regulator
MEIFSMVAGRPISEVCRDLAAKASRDSFDILSMLLRMASLEAAKHDVTYDGAPYVFEADHALRNPALQTSPVVRQGAATRLGISTMLFAPFLDDGGDRKLGDVEVYADICTSIASSFDAGRLDIAVVMDVKENRSKLAGRIVEEIPIEFAWACAKGFKPQRGWPIPLAIWPGDQFALDALNDAGCDYRVVCTTSDYLSKIAAVKSGACIAAVPRVTIRAPLIEACFDELPPIASKTLLVGAQKEAWDVHLKPIISRLQSVMCHS